MNFSPRDAITIPALTSGFYIHEGYKRLAIRMVVRAWTMQWPENTFAKFRFNFSRPNKTLWVSDGGLYSKFRLSVLSPNAVTSSSARMLWGPAAACALAFAFGMTQHALEDYVGIAAFWAVSGLYRVR